MKKLLALLLAAMMVIGLAPLALAEDTVLTVVTWDVAANPYLQLTKEAFEASHPGVVIEYIDVSSQDYDAQKPTTMLAGGDTADVFDIKQLPDLQNWIAQDFVVSLDDYIAASGLDVSRYLGMDKCYVDAEGRAFGLPYRSDFWVLYYNKDLFDAAGVAYPASDMTWDEYAELARKMTSGTEGVDKVYGTHYHTWLSDVANWPVADGVYTLIDGNYEPLRYFYNLAQGLEDDGACMTYSDLKASGLHYRAAFEAGNVAMIPMGYWMVAQLITDIKAGTSNLTNFGIVPVPHLEGLPSGSSFGAPTGCAINKNSANKDLAYEFIAWRCGEEGAKVFASAGARPAYVSEAVADALSSVDGFPSDPASKAALLPVVVGLEWPVVANVNEFKTIVNEEHTAIMSRDITVDEGIANMSERVAEVPGK
ncbi:MAG: sugar ABC transporter substrate-binding protein [Firmicutes bacterium]|nr:sugar ABC transporter substrate-binding protein [Bacillota bacterium]